MRRGKRACLQRTAPAGGIHHGFVDKFLNEHEWTPGKALPPVVPGWSTFNTVFVSVYDGWDFAAPGWSTSGCRSPRRPAPPASTSDVAKDRAYAGTVIGDPALDS